MDASTKIERFETLNHLLESIDNDIQCPSLYAQRYCVRFMMLNNFHTFRDLGKALAQRHVKALNMEDLLEEDDTWITSDMLQSAIEGTQESVVITPFSELVRFYDESEFRGFFNQIILTEDLAHPNKRIYIPLIGLGNRFSDFLRHFARIEECAPIWQLSTEEQRVKVFLPKNSSLSFPNTPTINTFRDWLKFWKTSAPQDQLLCYSLPIRLYNHHAIPDNIFVFRNIENAHDLLTQFWGMTLPIEYQEEDDPYWMQLCKDIDKISPKQFDFNRYVKGLFNKQRFEQSDIIEAWSNLDTTTYKRWILIQYLKATTQEGSSKYLVHCLDGIGSLNMASVLCEKIAEEIFYDDAASQNIYAEERRGIMKSMAALFREKVSSSKQEWMRNYIVELFQKQNNFQLAIKLCTGVFQFEKVLLLGWYSEGKVSATALKDYFPELAMYIAQSPPRSINLKQLWANDYLYQYRCSKIKDGISSQLQQMITERNRDKSSFYNWYYSFTESHEYLSALQPQPDKIYWIDGLGAEFLPLTQWAIEQENSNFKIVDSTITRSTIPSSTQLNRFEGANVVKHEGIDKVAHGDIYRKYHTLIEEIDALLDSIHQIVQDNKTERCTIAIVSDHGLSALSRRVESKKYNPDAEHEGRYLKLSEGIEADDADYITHSNENDGKNYKVALRHASIGKKPVHEVHGGCTPEEVLVPFVVISNKGQSNAVQYEVSLETPKVPITKPIVSFNIKPQPQNAYIMMGDKKIELQRSLNNWRAPLPVTREGDCVIFLMPHGGIPIEFVVEVYGISFGNINSMIEF